MEDLFGMREVKQKGASYDELPQNVYLVARTSDKEKAGPRIVENRDGEPFLFKTGVFVIGGDGEKVGKKFFGRYAWFSAFLRPNYKEQGGPQTQEEWNTLSGRLVSFINATLSPGIEDEEAAWNNSYDQLANYALELKDATQPLTPDMFNLPEGGRDGAAYMASVFAGLLRTSPRTILASTVQEAQRNDPTRIDTNVRGYRAGTAEEAAKAGRLAIFPNRDGVVEYEFAPSTVAEDGEEDF
jgi:hypothetical protein